MEDEMKYHENIQDIIDSLNDLYMQCDFVDQYRDCADNSVYEEAIDIASKSLESIENIKSKISELKKSQMLQMEGQTNNQDYLSGYICALSVVEGIIAGET